MNSTGLDNGFTLLSSSGIAFTESTEFLKFISKKTKTNSPPDSISIHDLIKNILNCERGTKNSTWNSISDAYFDTKSRPADSDEPMFLSKVPPAKSFIFDTAQKLSVEVDYLFPIQLFIFKNCSADQKSVEKMILQAKNISKQTLAQIEKINKT